MMDANSGYVGWSMSRRAAEAYEDGEMPKSKWTKGAMVAAIRDCCDEFDLAYDPKVESMRKDELFHRFFEVTSWHHTSKFFNETDFYGIDEGEMEDAFRPMTAEEISERDAAREAALAAYLEQRSALDARREAALNRYRAYTEAHGFAPDTVAAFAREHPECCAERMSRKGNRVLNYIDYHGDERCCPVDRAAQTHLYGFDATEPGSFDSAIRSHLKRKDGAARQASPPSLGDASRDMRRSCAELSGSDASHGTVLETSETR